MTKKKNYKKKKRMNKAKLKKRFSVLSAIAVLLFIVVFSVALLDKFPNYTLTAESIRNFASAYITNELEDYFKVIQKKAENYEKILETYWYRIQYFLKYDDGESSFTSDMVSEYEGEPYVVVNDNIPFFTQEDITTECFEYYSELDLLGRCGMTWACIGREIMPTEERGAIGMIRPSGWHLKKYSIVDGNYLYNRCHLIGFQLTGENANEKNLITGTRYLNVQGMLPFENETADYIYETGNHVMYRVTPIFEENNLVASGVLMEALSVEDCGSGLHFCVYVYNVQPGIEIDYETGESCLAG